MKKPFFILLALVAFLVGCPTPPAPEVDASDFDAGLAPHRLGSFSPAAGATNTVQTSNGSAGFSGATNVLAGTSFVSIGTSPSASGNVRLNNTGTITFLGVGGSVDRPFFLANASDGFTLGDSTTLLGTIRVRSNAQIFVQGELGVGIGNNTGYWLYSAGTAGAAIETSGPITGSTGASGAFVSPYGVHGTVISAMTNADYAVPSSEYQFQQIEVPATLTITVANKHFKLPTPATEALSYTKEVSNLNSGAFSLLVGRADGAGVTVTIAQNFKATVRIRPAGAYLMAAAIAAP